MAKYEDELYQSDVQQGCSQFGPLGSSIPIITIRQVRFTSPEAYRLEYRVRWAATGYVDPHPICVGYVPSVVEAEKWVEHQGLKLGEGGLFHRRIEEPVSQQMPVQPGQSLVTHHG